MKLINYLYKLTDNSKLGQVRGVWRFRKFLKKYILINNRYFKVPYLGKSIYVCPNHSMGRKIFEGGVYEPAIINSIQTFMLNGYSFIDIGANIGSHTLAAAFAIVSKDQVVFSFEPNKDIFAVLEKNCLLNNLKFVECVQKGLGDINTFSPLNVSSTKNKGRSSFLARNNTTPSDPIEVTTLDTMFLGNEELNSKCILIKIDTEGYELPIILGGIKWLSKVKQLAIICEVSPKLMNENGMKLENLFDALKKCGLDKYIVCKDDETMEDLGIDSDQYIAIFYKGSLSRNILS